jgi:hypothetical protein
MAEDLNRVCARRSNLNDALAASAARWTVDQAITAGATVIYLEDLRSMEAKGMGRSLRSCPLTGLGVCRSNGFPGAASGLGDLRGAYA